MLLDDMTDDQLRALDRRTIETELSNRVYAAALLIERLENAGLARGKIRS